MEKKLIIPVIAFFLMLIVGITNLMGDIQEHETWQIIVSSLSIALTIIAAMIGSVYLYRNRGKQA